MSTLVTVLLYPLTYTVSRLVECLDTELDPAMVALITGSK